MLPILGHFKFPGHSGTPPAAPPLRPSGDSRVQENGRCSPGFPDPRSVSAARSLPERLPGRPLTASEATWRGDLPACEIPRNSGDFNFPGSRRPGSRSGPSFPGAPHPRLRTGRCRDPKVRENGRPSGSAEEAQHRRDGTPFEPSTRIPTGRKCRILQYYETRKAANRNVADAPTSAEGEVMFELLLWILVPRDDSTECGPWMDPHG